jgi:hypothetical protein
MNLEVDQFPPNASISILGGSVPCDGTQYTRTLNIEIHPDAPKGYQEYRIKGTLPGGGSCEVENEVEVAGVTDVKWTEFPGNPALEWIPLPSQASSYKMFPGAAQAIDPLKNQRKKVRMLASIYPEIEGCRVEFRSFDVDDPFDDTHITMPNVGVIDNDSSGPDNFLPAGSDPGVGTWVGFADSLGDAYVDIEVSLQPGNNYNFTASTGVGVVASVTQCDADQDGADFGGRLTIWRRVWLELDSMAFGTDISLSGKIDEINNIHHPGEGRVELNVSDINDEGRFESGVMTVAGTGSTYTIVDNVDHFVDDHYFMSLPVAVGDLNSTATVVDDDSATLPVTPNANINVLNSKYANAYIEFFENTATRDLTNTFVSSLPTNDTWIAASGLENAFLTPADAQWVAIVVTGYESHSSTELFPFETESTVDGDPDLKYHFHGTVFKWGDTALRLGITPSSTENVSIIFNETLWDHLSQIGAGVRPGVWQPMTFTEPRIIAREIAHQLGVGIPLPGASLTLMSPYDGVDRDFSAQEIAWIRGSTELASH